MKKLLLTLSLVLAAHSATASVLELTASPLNPQPGARNKFVKVESSGQVTATYCYIATGVCEPTIYLATLSPYAMNHIFSLLGEARGGVIVEEKPLCAAVPSESKTYTADNGTITLERGTYPCGVFQLNTSNAADYFLGILKQYEN